MLMMPIIALIAVDRPEDKGLLPYGRVDDVADTNAAAPVLLTNREILRRFDFWTIGVGYVLTVTVYLALVAVMVPYAQTFVVTALEASRSP